ncbi:hypothetical protein Lal_00041170 [Lupinus albus]|nr:hypothetical protein Lal_00041170 [Lupinus albus]
MLSDLAHPVVRQTVRGTGNRDARHRLAVDVEDRRGHAAHPCRALLVIDGVAPCAGGLDILAESSQRPDRLRRELLEGPALEQALDALAVEGAEQGLADPRRVKRREGARREERADRFVRLHLADEQYAPVLLDPEIRGLAGLLHQRPHGRAAAFHHVAPPQEGRAEAVGFRADMPFLLVGADLHEGAPFEGRQHPVHRRHRLPELGRQFRERQPVTVREHFEHVEGAVQSLDRPRRLAPPNPFGRPRRRFPASMRPSRSVPTHRSRLENFFVQRKKNPVFIPGPTNMPEVLRRAADMPTLDHRSSLFGQILQPALAGVKAVLKTADAQVFLFPPPRPAAGRRPCRTR